MRPRAAEEPPLRREYPVSRQDVTVGVDAAGSIQSRQWGQFAPVAVKLKEYRVSLGAQVAEGDVLAEYDLEDLQRLARESEARLAEKQSALDKLDLQKKDDEARLQQEIDQLRAAGSESANAGLNTLEQKKQELAAQSEQQRQAEQAALAEKEALLQKHSQRPQVIADCDSRLAQLEEERARLQQELLSQVMPQATMRTETPYRAKGALSITAGYNDQGLVGYCVEVQAHGFGGLLTAVVGVNTNGEVTGVAVTDHKETLDVGTKAMEESYLSQFIGKSGTIRTSGSNAVDAVSGATATSEAVTSCVNQALAIVANLDTEGEVDYADGAV